MSSRIGNINTIYEDLTKISSTEAKRMLRLGISSVRKLQGPNPKSGSRTIYLQLPSSDMSDVPKYADYLSTMYRNVKSVKVDGDSIEIQTSGKIKVKFNKPKTTGGAVIKTSVQEKGTTIVLNQVLHKNKSFKKKEDILADQETADELMEVFKGYEDRLVDWTHSYFEQQKEFLKKFSSSKWDEFKYGQDDFVAFFSKQILNKVARSFNPEEKVGNYTTWNPSDIWAVYDMNDVKNKIKKNVTPATQSLAELNSLLIELFQSGKLVGLSLKKVATNKTASLKFVNVDTSTMKLSEIEKYKMQDIKFDIDNIFDGEKVTTYVKYGRGNAYSVNITKANNNLGFNTAIKKTPAAQGGQAPVKMVIELLRRKGRTTFTNEYSKYPKNYKSFDKDSSKIEMWYNGVQKYSKSSTSYEKFKSLIVKLYSDGKEEIAISKLMQLHFFYDALTTYNDDKTGSEFWTDLLYFGMKVGDRFAPHAKIS
jgi:hypothetical protein|tara:strand:+ start:41 stop:1477 length:1437 start_codon:yes stop_codon:yes gene_type:complete